MQIGRFRTGQSDYRSSLGKNIFYVESEFLLSRENEILKGTITIPLDGYQM